MENTNDEVVVAPEEATVEAPIEEAAASAPEETTVPGPEEVAA